MSVAEAVTRSLFPCVCRCLGGALSSLVTELSRLFSAGALAGAACVCVSAGAPTDDTSVFGALAASAARAAVAVSFLFCVPDDTRPRAAPVVTSPAEPHTPVVIAVGPAAPVRAHVEVECVLPFAVHTGGVCSVVDPLEEEGRRVLRVTLVRAALVDMSSTRDLPVPLNVRRLWRL